MVLEFISVVPNCFSHLEQIWSALSVVSGSIKAKINRELSSFVFKREWKLQKKKGYITLWQITPEGSSYLGKAPLSLRGKGKGKFLHAAGIHFVSRWAKNHGFECEIERPVGRCMKMVDVVLTNKSTGEIFAVEICTSDVGKEISNIVQDLAGDSGISRVVLATVDGKMKRKLESLIKEEAELAPLLDRISVRLIGEFIE